MACEEQTCISAYLRSRTAVRRTSRCEGILKGRRCGTWQCVCVCVCVSGDDAIRLGVTTHQGEAVGLPTDTHADALIGELAAKYQTATVILEGPNVPDFNTPVVRSTRAMAVAAGRYGLRLRLLASTSAEHSRQLMMTVLQGMRTYAPPLPQSSHPQGSPLGAMMESTVKSIPEAATEQERFLTAFFGVNPVTAHALLCLGLPIRDLLAVGPAELAERLSCLGVTAVPQPSLMLLHEQSWACCLERLRFDTPDKAAAVERRYQASPHLYGA
jgi:hypothetical protein